MYSIKSFLLLKMIQNKHKTADLMRWSLLHCWFDEVKFVALLVWWGEVCCTMFFNKIIQDVGPEPWLDYQDVDGIVTWLKIQIPTFVMVSNRVLVFSLGPFKHPNIVHYNNFYHFYSKWNFRKGSQDKDDWFLWIIGVFLCVYMN